MTSLKHVLDELFIALDAAPYDSGAIKKEADKEIYETYLMFAFRKLQAAKYHSSNIEKMLNAATSKATKMALEGHALKKGSTKLKMTKSTIKVQETPLGYAYELVAFLAAIRSALDFLAQVSAMHFKGVKADSVSVLMKLAGKGMTGPLLDEFIAKLDWLTLIRDYRGQLIHRMVMMPKGGWTSVKFSDTVSTEMHPVVVPKTTPKFMPDTRVSRMMDGELELPGVLESSSSSWITYSGGTKTVQSHSLSYTAAPGFLLIEDFTKLHAGELEGLFIAIVKKLTELKFAMAPIKIG